MIERYLLLIYDMPWKNSRYIGTQLSTNQLYSVPSFCFQHFLLNILKTINYNIFGPKYIHPLEWKKSKFSFRKAPSTTSGFTQPTIWILRGFSIANHMKSTKMTTLKNGARCVKYFKSKRRKKSKKSPFIILRKNKFSSMFISVGKNR